MPSRPPGAGLPPGPVVHLLDEDPDLGEGLDPASEAELRRAAVARVIPVAPGVWPIQEVLTPNRGHFGLLMLDGLLTREVAVAGAAATELFAPGDLLRPWEDDEFLSVSVELTWTVLEPSRFAVLDRRFAAATARWPTFVAAMMSRYVRRARWLALQLALTHLRRVDARLMVLLWNLGDRLGRVRPGGIYLPVRLKHELLARLVGARRPSVTTALGQLTERGLVRPHEGGWLLLGADPREELDRFLTQHA